MLVKDQLRVRMEQLDMPITEISRRIGVSSQTIRHWLAGRNFPGKAKCQLLEDTLSFKLDFSEGAGDKGVTVEETLRNIDVDTLVAISKLSPRAKSLFASLAEEFVVAQGAVPIEPGGRLAAILPGHALRAGPPGPANHGRRKVDLSARKKVG